jgi:hypothetical protein
MPWPVTRHRRFDCRRDRVLTAMSQSESGPRERERYAGVGRRQPTMAARSCGERSHAERVDEVDDRALPPAIVSTAQGALHQVS